MKRLFLLRGAPASGKSTWIKSNGFEPYTISSDDIRLLMRGPVMDIDGQLNIPQSDNREVWSLVQNIMKQRMANGDLVILDATNLKTEDMRIYKKLASEYRYRTFVVDFTDVPCDECIRRNANRDEISRVPEYIIERFYKALPQNSVPPYAAVISPDDAKIMICDSSSLDVSQYSAVNLFGDIHGCYTALMDLLGKIGAADGELSSDELYVFCGDYLDRGLENAEVFSYMSRIAELPNTMLLEGNHESWLNAWAHGEFYKSTPVRTETIAQLESAGISAKDISVFYRRLIPMAWLEDACGRKIFACHGGISAFPRPFLGISAEQLIMGVGSYTDINEVDAHWEIDAGVNGTYQVHGHRSASGMDINPEEHVFNLDGCVEKGGEMRCVRFSSDGAIATYCVDNAVFNHIDHDRELSEMTFTDALDNLRANPQIKEKNLGGGISSFNFTREAFLNRAWTVQNVKARGLFIDIDNERIKARSYDKFFAIDERPETAFEQVLATLTYPVNVYIKENGYLGICSSNDDGTLFCASKSTNKGDFASRFRKMLASALGSRSKKFANLLADMDATAVFEVIDSQCDRHIIDYRGESKVVLLDIIYNDFKFEHLPYAELVKIANEFKIEVKKEAQQIDTRSQMCEWYENVCSQEYTYNGEYIEGFVIADANDNIYKVKGDYYRYWKSIRGMIHDIWRRGKSSRVQNLVGEHPEVEAFYEWLKGYVKNLKAEKTKEEPHVIDIRNAYQRYLNEQQQ